MTHTYELDGSIIVQETWGENQLVPMYDVTGSVLGILYNNTPYYFMRNLQGDVIGVVNNSGTLVAEYSYDAWGKCSIVGDNSGVDIANVNPFRYRGYYYDSEIGLYYCNARYYDANVGRWISGDAIRYLDPSSSSGVNLYCYCEDDPVMYMDPSGQSYVLAIVLCVVAIIGIGLTVGGVASDNNTMTAIGLTMVAIAALISGGMALYCAGAAGTMIIGGITVTAGVGTGLFASAEYQQAFTGNNWMLDAGMSEGLYNGLMLATAAIATAGTAASMAGVTQYQNYGDSNWYGGWQKMRSHFLAHGKSQMGYKNVFDYTNGAKAIINNGGVYASKVNAYAQWIAGNKYFYVGVGQNSNLITTYFIKTITYTKYLSIL